MPATSFITTPGLDAARLQLEGRNHHRSRARRLPERPTVVLARPLVRCCAIRLLTLIDPIPRAAPFDHPDWVFEAKFDGFRAAADTVRGRLISRKRPPDAAVRGGA